NMGVEKAQSQCHDHVEEPLHTIGDTFETFSSIVNNDDLESGKYMSIDAIITLGNGLLNNQASNPLVILNIYNSLSFLSQFLCQHSLVIFMPATKQDQVSVFYLCFLCAPSVRALLKGANGSNYHISLKSGLFGTRLFKTHSAFPSKVSQVARKNRTCIVMQDSTARSYATALAELAQSVKSLDAISRDIDKLSQYITNKVFFNFLINPIIPDEKKKGILEDITNDAKFQPYTLNFLYILIDKKRIDLISEIFKEFETVYNKQTDTKLAVVSSVVKLENQISLGPSQNQCN
ncbi:hypothetical protein KI387_034852, partial [Taxus chinensis]